MSLSRESEARREGANAKCFNRYDQIAGLAIDSLLTSVAVVDRRCTIVAANKQWFDFAAASGGPECQNAFTGCHYLTICKFIIGTDRKVRRDFARGLRAVLCGSRQLFEMEYAYHTVAERRWFMARITGLAHSRPLHAVIAHENITPRILAEISRRESEEKYRILLESAAVGMGYFDLSGKLILFNAIAARHMGGAPSDFCGRSVYQLFGRQLGDLVKRRIKFAASNNRIRTYEDEVTITTGTKWFLSTYNAIRNAEGGISGVQIVSAEITQQKVAERALRDSEQRAREVLENSQDFPYKRNLRSDSYEYMSTACARACGYQPKEFGGLRFSQFLNLVHPEDRTAVERVRLDAISHSREPYELEYRFRRKNGQYRWFHDRFTVIKEADGKPAAIIGSVRDITDRKHVEEALRRSETCLADAQSLARIGSWRVDFHERAEEWTYSKELGEIWGKPSRMRVALQEGRSPIHPADRRRVAAMWGAALRTGRPTAWEHRIVANGKVKWLHVRIRIERASGVRITAVSGTVQDITEQRETEEIVQEQQAALVHLSRLVTMGEIASSVAHEITQPLGAGLLYAETCRDLLSAPLFHKKQIDQAIGNLISQLERAKSTVSRLRRFVRKQPLSISACDLNDIIHDSVDALAHQIKNASVRVRLRVRPTPILIHADSTLIQQVTINLIINAVHAVLGNLPNDRTLLLSTAIDDQDNCIVTVGDNGPGVAEHVREHLFRSFVTTKSEGMGLGLAISRSIIEQHGGRVWYESNRKRGSLFRFSIPTIAHRESWSLT